MTPENALLYLREQANRISNEAVRSAAKRVVDDPFFAQWPASGDKHHCYPGALSVHTAEVMEIAMRTAQSMSLQPVNYDVIRAAVIFHDVMKIRDRRRTEDGKFENTDYKKRIYHIAGSYAAWVDQANRWSVPEELQDAIGHCILSHHGRPEWGSAIEPQTVEAQIVHGADMLSALYGNNR